MSETTLTTPPSVTSSNSVSLRGVSKIFEGGSSPTVALQGIDLELEPGEFVCIVGKSGCGKSTLLRMVAGFEATSAGDVEVDGVAVRRPGPDRGVVFQDYGLFPWLSVAENIGFGPRERGVPREERERTVERFATLVGLGGVLDRYPGQLSGGMQQRVAIARVLANDAKVLLMDEPFGALDSLTRERMQEELRRISSELGATTIFITHNVEEAVYLADRVVVMSGDPSQQVPGFVQTIVPIDLPHPRDVTDPTFNRLRRQLLDEVHADE